MKQFDLTEKGFWQSFNAAIIAFPLFFFVAVINFQGKELTFYLSTQFILYLMSWILFPISMIFFLRFLRLTNSFVPLIVASNWTTVIQGFLFLPVAILGAFGRLSEGIGPVLLLSVMLFLLFYKWFVARIALQSGSMAAISIVAIDILLAFSLNAGAGRLA